MPLVDKILYLENGNQAFYGTYGELEEDGIIDIKAILDTKEKKVEMDGLKVTLKEDEKKSLKSDQGKKVGEKGNEGKGGNLIGKEQTIKGGLKCRDCCFYFGNAYGWVVNGLFLFMLIAPHFVKGYFMLFLTEWVQAEDQS